MGSGIKQLYWKKKYSPQIVSWSVVSRAKHNGIKPTHVLLYYSVSALWVNIFQWYLRLIFWQYTVTKTNENFRAQSLARNSHRAMNCPASNSLAQKQPLRSSKVDGADRIGPPRGTGAVAGPAASPGWTESVSSRRSLSFQRGLKPERRRNRAEHWGPMSASWNFDLLL